MQKVSEFMCRLREIAPRYDWSIEGGTIQGRSRQSRRTRTERSRGITPLVAVMRVITGNGRIRRFRADWACFHDYTNIPAIQRACRRPGRQGHSFREKWIRKLIVNCLNLGSQDD